MKNTLLSYLLNFSSFSELVCSTLVWSEIKLSGLSNWKKILNNTCWYYQNIYLLLFIIYELISFFFLSCLSFFLNVSFARFGPWVEISGTLWPLLVDIFSFWFKNTFPLVYIWFYFDQSIFFVLSEANISVAWLCSWKVVLGGFWSWCVFVTTNQFTMVFLDVG